MRINIHNSEKLERVFGYFEKGNDGITFSIKRNWFNIFSPMRSFLIKKGLEEGSSIEDIAKKYIRLFLWTELIDIINILDKEDLERVQIEVDKRLEKV